MLKTASPAKQRRYLVNLCTHSHWHGKKKNEKKISFWSLDLPKRFPDYQDQLIYKIIKTNINQYNTIINTKTT